MNIQSKLNSAIALKLESIPIKQQRSASSKLSDIYRHHDASPLDGHSKNLFLAYAATRMPATFAVASRVLGEYKILQNLKPTSMLDIGAGPGTASLAALEHFDIREFTLFEKQFEFRDLALALAKEMDISVLQKSTWQMGSISQDTIFPAVDLAIASYSLGEMPITVATDIAKRIFEKASAIIIIEPGTPKGFERIRYLRQVLIDLGAEIVAPCPHQKPCPMVGKDFCHFKERLGREKFHRESKDASLPFEDESFSYLIASKTAAMPVFGRIIRKPMKRSGHVTLDICHDGQIVRQTQSRKDKDQYRRAKNSAWGDIVN